MISAESEKVPTESLNIKYLLSFPFGVIPHSRIINTLNPKKASEAGLQQCTHHPGSPIQHGILIGKWVTLSDLIFGENSPFFREVIICTADGLDSSRHVLKLTEDNPDHPLK